MKERPARGSRIEGRHMRKKKLWMVPAGLIMIIIIGFFIYVSDYCRAGDKALGALEPDSVSVERAEYGWFFDGPADDRCLIFYPGAKVDETAYAPLLRTLAASGVDCFAVKMPLGYAFLGVNRAKKLMKIYDYEKSK